MEKLLENIFTEYGIIGIVISCLLYMNILRLQSDLKDREANRKFLSEVAEMMRHQEAEIKVHAAKIKHIEKEVFKSKIRTE